MGSVWWAQLASFLLLGGLALQVQNQPVESVTQPSQTAASDDSGGGRRKDSLAGPHRGIYV